MKYRLSPATPGLTPHAVTIEPYNPDWPSMATHIAEQLRATLKDDLQTVEHVGSTSIPGLSAKAIIDLIPIVNDLSKLDAQQQSIKDLGYQWFGEFGITGRRFCTLTSPTGQRLVHLHFFEKGAANIKRHLAFRDYLLAHPQIALAYEQEKRRAAALHPHDSLAYNDEKADWVQKHEKDALEWYENSK